MHSLRANLTPVCSLLMLAASVTWGQVRLNSPQPGDIYREYIHVMNGNGDELQVRDPNIDTSRWEYLYAPPIDIRIDDLSGAVRAEAMIVYIGGHVSTVGQKLRWNDHEWVDIPLLDTSNGIPVGHPGYNYMMIHDITMDIPLSWLHEGTNTFQGTSGGQADPIWGWGWGQWGWYAMMVRIYYGSGKPHATGVISSHSSAGIISENPTITASIISGSARRIDFLAYYDDYDTDGDGIYLQYHHDYMFDSSQTSDASFTIKNHVGTATSAPWTVSWNTEWVPDQPAGQVKLLARIRDVNDVWYVTPEVQNLSLVRTGKSVKLYKPLDVPECCWVRLDVRNGTEIVHFNIPSSDKLADATAARYYVRLWNGGNYGWEKYPEFVDTRHFNSWSDVRFGARHAYTFDTRALPASALLSGENTWDWYCNINYDHGIEILWPGPALAVRYTGNYASPIPGMAALAYPPNDFSDQVTDVTLKWHPGPAATSYDVQLSNDSLFGSIAREFTGVTDTSVQVGFLSSQTKYYWRVRAVNLAGASSYSDAWSFTTALLPPTVPSQHLPADNATNEPVDLTIRWYHAFNAQRYHLQLGTDSTFAGGLVVDDSSIVDTARTMSALANDIKYYWHVQSANSAGPSAFSPVWSFRTIVQVPVGVVPIWPGNGAVVFARDSMVCAWMKGAPSVDRYRFEIANDSLFTSSTVDSTLVDTIKVIHSPAHGRYWWKVAAHNAAGWGPSSAVQSFMAVDTGIRDAEGLPEQFTLSQNYPNPFNPTTIIRFGLPQRKHVRLRIYNTLGEEVGSLIDGEVEPGYHEVTFDAPNLASGVYYYRLVAGNYVETKKFLLLR